MSNGDPNELPEQFKQAMGVLGLQFQQAVSALVDEYVRKLAVVGVHAGDSPDYAVRTSKNTIIVHLFRCALSAMTETQGNQDFDQETVLDLFTKIHGMAELQPRKPGT